MDRLIVNSSGFGDGRFENLPNHDPSLSMAFIRSAVKAIKKDLYPLGKGLAYNVPTLPTKPRFPRNDDFVE